jgi:hypothetical protein
MVPSVVHVEKAGFAEPGWAATLEYDAFLVEVIKTAPPLAALGAGREAVARQQAAWFNR